MTTSCTDCNVDVQDVDITTPYDHVDAIEAAGEQVPVVDDVDRSTVALPPDGGWGWIVVTAAFISNLIVGGVCYMFGIIMPELLQYFQAGKGKTAFVGSVVPGTLSIIGMSNLLTCSINTLFHCSIGRHSQSSNCKNLYS